MKKFKLLLAIVLCLALIFTCAVSFASCKNKDGDNGAAGSGSESSGNENSGNETPGDNTPPHKHSYTAAITKYPGVNVKGEKTFKCSCGDYYVEEIEAATFTIPSLSDALAEIIGEHTYGLEVSTGSEIVLVKEADVENSVNGYKNFIAFKVAEASVSGEGGVFKGMLALEVGYVSVELDGSSSSESCVLPDTFDKIITIDAYVNGEAVSISFGENDDVKETEIENISRVIYSAIADRVGLTYDQLVELYYVADQLGEYAPLVEGIVDVINASKLPEAQQGLNELVALIASTVFTTAQDGDNVIYSLNIEDLDELIAAIENKTVTELIDEEYGEGTADVIAEFIKAIPMTTVRQLTDKAADFSEGCDIPIEQIYAFINYAVNIVSDMEFDITEHIESNANLTVAAIIGQYYGNEDIASYEKTLSEKLTEIVDMVAGSTLNEIYAQHTGIDPEEMSLTFLINTYIYAIDRAIGFRACLDQNGNLLWVHIDIAGGELDVNIDGSIITLYYTEEGDELFEAVITLMDSGEIWEARATAKYVDVEYDQVLDSTGQEYVEIERKVLKTLFTFNYNNNVTDFGCHWICITYEDVSINVEIGDSSDENGVILDGHFNVVKDGVEISVGDLDYISDEYGSSFELVINNESDVISVSYSNSADGQSLLVKKNDDVAYKLVYVVSEDEDGVQTLENFEFIIGTYAYNTWMMFEDESLEDEEVVGESIPIYYQPINIIYAANDDGDVSYSLVVNDVSYTDNYEYDEEGDIIFWENIADVECVLMLNGSNNGFTATVNGIEFEVEILENGLSASFEMDGAEMTANITFDESGVFLSFNANDILTSVALNSTENGFAFDGELCFGDVTLFDGKIGFELVSDESSDNLIINIDIDEMSLEDLFALIPEMLPDVGDNHETLEPEEDMGVEDDY